LFRKTDRYGCAWVLICLNWHEDYDEGYKGIEFVGDYRLTKKIFFGCWNWNENKTTDDDRLNFTTKGSYLKVGFDYNAYENWLDMENIIPLVCAMVSVL
jgi:hypothetical protein